MPHDQIPAVHLELITLLNATNQSDEYARALRIIEQDHQDTIPLFIRCLTTGSDQAMEQIAHHVHELIEDINRNYADGVKTDYNQGLRYPRSTSNTLWIWNSANVIDECGVSYVDGNDDIITKTSMVESLYPLLRREHLKFPQEDAHWRGLAVMALTGLWRTQVGRVELHLLHPYLKWAGAHHDIASVIHVTNERGTYCVSTLTGVLDERARTASGLAQGVL